jgi:hypothetical protein
MWSTTQPEAQYNIGSANTQRGQHKQVEIPPTYAFITPCGARHNRRQYTLVVTNTPDIRFHYSMWSTTQPEAQYNINGKQKLTV